MKKTIPAFLLSLFSFLLLSVTSIAQTGFTGTIRDSSENKFLKNAVVSLLKASDSVLVKYIRTGDNGKFVLDKIPTGKYIIEVSYPGYANYADVVESNSNELVNLSTINILPKAKLLEEIVIQQKVAAIRIKGDTTEFKADSFKVGPNANVQELLKRLPGLQVNAKGEITAQGQKVQKVLVDGEEFFSDDPAVVTENLRADLVDKVQVFDKKSEQAEFTGVDDGEKTKTINLELKEDKKKGFFGKIEVGSDFDRYRNAKAMINAFKKKQKVTAYATHNNISFSGLNWNERNNFGSSNMNIQEMDGGGMMMWSEGDDFDYGRGLPVSTTAGIGYANKWNKDKNNVSGNYQFNDQNVKGLNTSFRKTITETGSFSNYSTENFSTSGRRNKLSGLYEWKIDSNNTIKIKVNGSFTNQNNINNYSGNSVTEANKALNNINRTISNNNETKDFSSELSWKKKFKKQGRTFSYYGNLRNNTSTGFGFLSSTTNFYDTNEQLIKSQIIDQKKGGDATNSSIGNRLVYTESLLKKTFLEISYSNAFNNNNSERNTLEKGNSSDYKTKVDSLSNHLIYNTVNHSGGVSFRFNDKKFNLNFGARAGRTTYNLKEINKGYNNNITFTNLLPNMFFTYMPRKQKRFSISYNGSTQDPSLQQINPIIDNIDPLNITIGNSKLKQSFVHNFGININDYKVLKSKSFYLSANFNFTNNAITSSSKIEINTGKTTTQYINTNGNYNGYFWSRYGFEIAKSFNLDFGLNGSVNRYINFIDSKRNSTNSYRISPSIGFAMWNDKWINFNLNLSPGFNFSNSTINTIKNQYMSFNTYPYINMKFKKQKLYLDLDGQILLYGKNDVFKTQQNRAIINTSLRKTLTKKDALEVKLSVNDLFNQNTSVNRSISSNVLAESTNQNIKRFYLLSFIWNFSKNGKPSNF